MTANQAKPFQPIRFLAAMATGGLASAPYLFRETAALHGSLAAWATWASVLFIAVHYALTIGFFVQGRKWLMGPGLKTFREDWTKSPQILMPLGALAMSINVWVGPVRGIFPIVDSAMAIWAPLLTIAWIMIAVVSLWTVTGLLTQVYAGAIEITKLGFVWLFPSLALGLVATSGSFLAGMAPLSWEAHVTGLGSAVAALAGLFVMAVMVPTVVRNQLRAQALPPQGGSYSILNMIPTVALYGIAFFHWSAYAEHWLGWNMKSAAGMVMLVTWAFATGYMVFGFRLLYKTIKTDLMQKNYVGNQWALSCVPIAWSVLTSLLQIALFPSMGWTVLAGVAIIATAPVFILLVLRMTHCVGWRKSGSGAISCV